MIRGQKVNIKKGPAYKMDVALHNRFDVEVISSKTGKVKRRAVGFNLILDAMWTRCATDAQWFKSIAYGSGSGSLAASRTDLFTRVSAKTAGTLTADFTHWDQGYVSFRQQIQIGAGEITGTTLKEVGIAYDNSAGHLMTHALLKDMNGNTITITVGDLDVINIYATVFVRFASAGYEGGNVYLANISNTAYVARGSLLYGVAGCADMFSSAAQFGKYMAAYSGQPFEPIRESSLSYDGWDGYISSVKTGLCTYNPATKKILCQFSLAAGASYRIGAADCNPTDAGGWNGVAIFASRTDPYHSGICIRFPNDAKPYCTITDEAVGTGDGSNLDFALDFGFILNDGSAVVKVDGTTVDSENYTIDYAKPAHNKLKYFMRPISGVIAGSCTFFNHANTGYATSAAGDWQIAENPLYALYGITSFYRRAGVKVEASNDLTDWSEVCAATVATGTFTVTTYKNYRYWRVSTPDGISSIQNIFNAIASSEISLTHLHFAAGQAPASGKAITATYRTGSICKDANHVVDLELEISLQEYTP